MVELRDLHASARAGPHLPPTFVRDMARLAWESMGFDWPRQRRFKHPNQFVTYRAQLLAEYCRERGLNPMDLDNNAIIEALPMYATVQSMKNALRARGVKAKDIAAEAYHLIRSENSSEMCT